MLKSKIAPIIAGLVILVGAAAWIWMVNSIDYSRMNARGSHAKPAASAPAQPDSQPGNQPENQPGR